MKIDRLGYFEITAFLCLAVFMLLIFFSSERLKGFLITIYFSSPKHSKKGEVIFLTYNEKSMHSNPTEKSKRYCSSEQLQLTQPAFLQNPNLLTYIETKQEFLCIVLEALNAEKLTLGG